jgi:hypothetical protein
VLSQDDADAIGSLFQRLPDACRQITVLEFTDVGFTSPEAFKALMAALSLFPTLQSLRFHRTFTALHASPTVIISRCCILFMSMLV